MKIAVVGGGWSGMAAAVAAVQAGHQVTVWEASRTLGGRARALSATLPDGTPVMLDNGQHILIGAYRECLRLMLLVGVDPAQALLRMPLSLRFPDGEGFALPRWPFPLDALAGIAAARGWDWRDKLALVLQALRWQVGSFGCAADMSVADVCRDLTPRVRAELIEPLCISALNTVSGESSGVVFLRVIRDAVFGGGGSSHMLLPMVDLTSLFPSAAAAWLTQHGSTLHVGTRVQTLEQDGDRWSIDCETYDQVLLAVAPTDAVHLVQASLPRWNGATQHNTGHWLDLTRQLRHMPIATVYAWSANARLPRPMLALRSGPAQFVFDRGQLGGPAGLLAFVVSASEGDRATLQAQVLQQAQDECALQLQAVQTVIEKRATIACIPGLQRPSMAITSGLHACADYVDGPYPSTLEAAVRTALACVAAIR